jgi:hypothetical protein
MINMCSKNRAINSVDSGPICLNKLNVNADCREFRLFA